MLHDAREELARSAREAASALSRAEQHPRGDLLGGAHPPADAAGLHVLVEGVRAAAARIEALLPREAALTSLREEQASVARDLRSVTREQASARERAEELPPLLAEAERRVAELGRAGGRAEAVTVQLEQARLRLDAADRLEECLHTLGELRERQRAARDRAADAREHALELTQRRLAGIAAELAATLEPGHACQVCGSTEHPAPARPAADAVSETQQAAADADHERLRSAHADLTRQVAQLEERVVALRGTAAQRSPAAARIDVEDLERQLHAAQRATAELGEAEHELARLEQEQHAVHGVLRDLDTRRATTEHTAQTLEAAICQAALELEQALDPTLRAWLPSTGDEGLADLVARVHELAQTLTEAHETQRAREELSRRYAEIESRVTAAASERGFGELSMLEDAVLDDAERERLSTWLEERARREQHAREILDEPDVRAVEGGELLDTTPRAAALADAEQEESVAVRELHQREEAVAAIRRLRDRLDAALESWLPVREEAGRAEAIAQLVRGTGPDNQLQMRLSAYVLATRLDQVVAAANERLGQMRDRRYLLQRTGRASRRNARAGLGLEVVDQWTGEVREATTLSGGETFVVSLALALGLADVVTHEAGGTEIQTLFVDEGFGTLDEEMLDDVMDRLDELRTGGRAVGVVSHVSELRNRIPTQLHVTKTRTGSTLAIRTAVG
jgi:exonuclease SbcC